MPTAALAPFALAAAGLTLASDVAGGIIQGNVAHYQAQVAANNATVAAQNAQYSASATAAQVQQSGERSRQQLSGVRAGIAANNIDVNSGSAADVQQSQREVGQLNTNTVANRGALQVYGYQTQKANFQAESNLDEEEAKTAWLGGALKGAGQFAEMDPGAFGGTGFPSGGGDLEQGTFNPTASLLSGPPSVNPAYSWMQNSGNPLDLEP